MAYQKVDVYEDPQTRQRLEGTANLIKIEEFLSDGTALCLVEFDCDFGSQVHRIVSLKDIKVNTIIPPE